MCESGWRQRLPQDLDNRHAPRDGGFEGDAATKLAGLAEQFQTVLAQQRLVGGDDILAGGQRVEHQFPCRAEAPDQLDDDIHIGVTGDRGGIVGQDLGGEVDFPRFVEIADGDSRQLDRRPARRVTRSA